jgi:hypothetical protein
MAVLEHNTFAFIIPILFCLDAYLTYRFMDSYRKRCPDDKEWSRHEINPIARWAWGKFGLEKGCLIMVLIVSPFIISYTIVAYFSTFFLGLLIGIYLMIFRLHYEARKKIT